jgi:hypothetical protein
LPHTNAGVCESTAANWGDVVGDVCCAAEHRARAKRAVHQAKLTNAGVVVMWGRC